MVNEQFSELVTEYINTNPKNFVEPGLALKPELAGMRIFDEPLIGFADARDPYFAELKKADVIGDHFMLPLEWLPRARTVISFFLPFTDIVKIANRQDMDWPADEWLHARIEGQAFIGELCRHIIDVLHAEGFACVAPCIDPRFSTKSPVTDKTKQGFYTSNWSERHVAHVCALGTFGLSRGLITAKGIAGRFGSIVTDAVFEPTKRPYAGVNDYCTRCGACARNCPVGAISLDGGKKHLPCSTFLDKTKAKRPPWYGCGKCQVRVPCESRIP
jgi:epoxyqueuosine reductase QueG